MARLKKIIIAPDSFKGTMSSTEVCAIAAEAVASVRPDIETVLIPIADGGEGTVEAFLAAAGGEKIRAKVKGPRFDEIDSYFGMLRDCKTAVIEMAAASGLTLEGDAPDPSATTTFGTGQLMLAALDRGCTRMIIGIGGSATNDGGIGAAAALGVRFLDRDGAEIPLTGGGLARLARIDTSGVDKRLAGCEIMVACDVTNPLYGPEGAAHVFAPQKGADAEMVARLDENLRHFAGVIAEAAGFDPQSIPGTGAAGGLGVSLIAFAGARLMSGIEIMLDTAGFDAACSGTGLIITGEGRIDAQSLKGKVPVGVAARAARYGVPVVAVVGGIGDDIDAGDLARAGISAVFSTSQKPLPFEIAKTRCREDLRRTVINVISLINALE